MVGSGAEVVVGKLEVLEELLLLLLLLDVVLVVLELLVSAVDVAFGKTVVKVPLIVVATPDAVLEDEVVCIMLWSSDVSTRSEALPLHCKLTWRRKR